MLKFLENNHVQIVFHIPRNKVLLFSAVLNAFLHNYFIPVHAINPQIMHSQCRSKCRSTKYDIIPSSLMNLEATSGFEKKKKIEQTIAIIRLSRPNLCQCPLDFIFVTFELLSQ